MSDDHGAASYRAAGVDYEALDAGKAARESPRRSPPRNLLAARGAAARALDASRGEPAVRVRARRAELRVRRRGARYEVDRRAPRCSRSWGVNRFAGRRLRHGLRQSSNDLCCVGRACRSSVKRLLRHRRLRLVPRAGSRGSAARGGGRRACARRRAARGGGGESPSLPGLVDERDIELAGAAVGAVPAGRSPILGEQLGPGDEIVLVSSSGLHANGASLARLLAARLPDGYATADRGRPDARRGAPRAVGHVRPRSSRQRSRPSCR